MADQILSVSFSQDYNHVVCTTSRGFLIYSCDPFCPSPLSFELGTNSSSRSTFSEMLGSLDLPLAIADMYYSSHILIACVGAGGKSVLLWDMAFLKTGWLHFNSMVLAVRPRPSFVAVLTETALDIYSLPQLQLQYHAENNNNKRGLLAMPACWKTDILMAFPVPAGQVQLLELKEQIWELGRCIQAHSSEVACLSFSRQGNLLATASIKGTLVRIFDTAQGIRLMQLRRGLLPATIYSMAFSQNASKLVLSSDSGRVHIFNLDENAAPANALSKLNFMKDYLPDYFGSQWSFGQIRTPKIPHATCFGMDDNTVIVVGNGMYRKCTIDTSGHLVETVMIKLISGQEEKYEVRICW